MAVAAESIAILTVPARAERLKLVRALVGNAAENAGCRAETASQIVIAVNEACMNIIQHGYGDDMEGDIVVSVSRTGSELNIRIEDTAPPVDSDRLQPRDPDELRPGGLGTFFINEIMDNWTIGQRTERQGNYLQMSRKIE